MGETGLELRSVGNMAPLLEAQQEPSSFPEEQLSESSAANE